MIFVFETSHWDESYQIQQYQQDNDNIKREIAIDLSPFC